MLIEESTPPPVRTAYGRLFRERGTTKIVLAVVLFSLAWYVYSAVHTTLMNRVRWAPLKPEPTGLTVLGLRDRPRRGWQPSYKAFEVNKDWQIRRPEEDVAEEGRQDDSAEETPEAAERDANPGAAGGRGERGEVVSLDELLVNCPTVLTGRHFSGAWVEEKPPDLFDRLSWTVHLDLTDEGSSRYWQFSQDREGERLVFALNGDIITCPRMRHMNVRSISIEPIWDKADAEKLSGFVNAQSR